MKITVMRLEDKEIVGIVSNEKIWPLSISIEEFLRLDEARRDQITSEAQEKPAVALHEVQYAPIVPRHAKIICVGLNYRRHAEEAGQAIPTFPVLFNKFGNALAAHLDEVVLPGIAEHYDYEAELGIVIGKPAKNVSREDALERVFGYCCVNDLSARDLQNRTSQWLLGKSLDGFAPMGPYLVTADEVGDPNSLGIRLYLNGEIRQNSNTRDMIFPVDEIISYVSRYITLEPGDVILTGTPEGVIFGYPDDKKVWLKPGDTVTVEIDRLGALTNRLKGE